MTLDLEEFKVFCDDHSIAKHWLETEISNWKDLNHHQRKNAVNLRISEYFIGTLVWGMIIFVAFAIFDTFYLSKDKKPYWLDFSNVEMNTVWGTSSVYLPKYSDWGDSKEELLKQIYDKKDFHAEKFSTSVTSRQNITFVRTFTDTTNRGIFCRFCGNFSYYATGFNGAKLKGNDRDWIYVPNSTCKFARFRGFRTITFFLNATLNKMTNSVPTHVFQTAVDHWLTTPKLKWTFWSLMAIQGLCALIGYYLAYCESSGQELTCVRCGQVFNEN